MISKDTFIETMCALEILDSKMSNVDEALNKLCPDFGGFYIPEVCGLIMSVFSEMFNDKSNWLEFFVCENDFLNSMDPHNNLNITGWGDVYDFLISNMSDGDD